MIRDDSHNQGQYIDLTHEQLLVFAAVAQTLNFTEAGRRLNLSQPAVSQRISLLERQLGLDLFTRDNRQVRLTPAGCALHPHALKVRLELEAAHSTLQALKGEIAGPLRLGASTTIGSYWLPEVLVPFKRAYPAAVPTLRIENSARLMAELREGTLDILMLEGPRPALRDVRLRCEHFLDDHLLLIAGAEFRVPSTLDRSALARGPWILREPGSGTREVLLGHLARHGIAAEQLEVALELGSTEAIKRAVEHGAGITCLSALAIGPELAGGRFIRLPMPEMDIRRPLWLVRPHERFLSAVGRAFLEVLAARSEQGQ